MPWSEAESNIGEIDIKRTEYSYIQVIIEPRIGNSGFIHIMSGVYHVKAWWSLAASIYLTSLPHTIKFSGKPVRIFPI